MVLTPGSEVLLHCHGDVIVDRVLKVQGNTERPFIRAYQQDAGTHQMKDTLEKQQRPLLQHTKWRQEDP